MKQGQFPEVLLLGSLNGQNGFKIDGENNNDFSGWSVSAAGDINGDGHADLLIGAPQYSGVGPGRSYVVFGGPGVGKTGILLLSSLNGSNGFTLDGENNYDLCGNSVSAAGDINGDGYADVVIGASDDSVLIGASGDFEGHSYVVFGGPGVGKTGVLLLSSLNGNNGFKLDGENDFDGSGHSVSAAGDINGDGHADVLIGAPGYPSGNYKGRSYVVFGGPGVGKTGTLPLSSLDGSNGFKLDGENDFDGSGHSVSAAEDINGDGYDDVVIGAYVYGSAKGRSYVVFGGPGVGKTGTLLLSSLDGSNGFKLDGENNYDYSGCSVSTAGDINGDGYNDVVIGANYYPGGNNKGRSYVVFGGPGVGSKGGVLLLSSLNGNNGFTLDGENNGDDSGYSVSAAGDLNGDGYADVVIGADGYGGSWKGRSYLVFGGPGVGGKTGSLLLSSLNGSDGIKLDGENNGDASGIVSAAGDINADGVDDLLIGAFAYNAKGRSYVVFGDVPPVLVNNSLAAWSGGTIAVTPNDLGAYDRNHQNDSLVFVFTELQHGFFALKNAPAIPVINVTQGQVRNGSLQFMHDGSDVVPSYNVTVHSTGIAWTGPFTANVTFSSIFLENNQLIINQGQMLTLTAANLKATYANKVAGDLSFWVSDLIHGQFEYVALPHQPIVVFQQQNITDGFVRFIHDQSLYAPAYQIAVSNGVITTPPQPAGIDFDTIPLLLTNQLLINQGQSILFTTAMLNATHPGADSSPLRFDITELQQGQFHWVNNSASITYFYQQNITDKLVQFGHDGSSVAPSYNVSVTDGRTYSPSQAARINFDAFPILQNNTLRINQGETILLSNYQLSATHPGGADEVLVFNITNLGHGRFEWTTSPGKPITIFQQHNITESLVQFVHDNSTFAPAYQVTVSDGRLTTAPAGCLVDFDVPPILVNNQLTIGQDQTIVVTTDNLLSTQNGTARPDLVFIISNITNGGFLVSDVKEQSTSNLSFVQQQIINQAVRFYQQGTGTPGYQVSVTDGRMTLPPVSADIIFYVKPILTQNQFLVSAAQATVLTSANVAATRADELAEDLQFLVSSARHGRFEKRSSPGTEILSFYQKDVMQQGVQFVPDNSTQTPDSSLKAWDSSTDLASDVQESDIIFITHNNFPINQGETFLLTEAAIKASYNRGPDGQITFVPIAGTVQRGHFALAQTPNYVLASFQQSQITANEVVFVPDGSAQAPSAYLTVSDSPTGITLGTLNCQVDFDTPPVLQHTYLKTSTSEKTKMTDVNLKAVSDFVSAGKLIFEISAMKHGYFADNNDWNIELSNFTQQKITDNQIVFITDDSGMAPEFQVSVWDGRLHCQACPQPAEVVFNTNTSSSSSLSDVLKNAIIGAVASGVVGLLFFALKYKHSLGLQRNARPIIDGEEQETYSDALLLPIAREIFSRIKITGCLGYIGKRYYNEYIGAVSTIVAALETKGVIQPDNWNSLPRPQKQKIIDAIAMHAKELVGNNRCCSMRTFTGFYKAEATPRMIRDQADAIADAVQETLSDRTEAKSSRNRSSLRLTKASSGLQTPLLS